MTDWITWICVCSCVCVFVCMVLNLDFLQLLRVEEKITDVENLRKQHIDHQVGEQEWALQKTTDTSKPNHRYRHRHRYTQHNIRLAFNLSHTHTAQPIAKKPRDGWIETRTKKRIKTLLYLVVTAIKMHYTGITWIFSFVVSLFSQSVRMWRQWVEWDGMNALGYTFFSLFLWNEKDFRYLVAGLLLLVFCLAQ